MATCGLNPEWLGRVVCRSLRPKWKSHWLGTSVMGECGLCPFLIHAGIFHKTEENKENFRQGSPKFQGTFHCVDFAVFLMGILSWPAVFSRFLLRLRTNLISKKEPSWLLHVLGGSPGQITSLEILIPLVSTLLPLLHRRNLSVIEFLLHKTEGQTNSRKTEELAYSMFLD
jgi:hypothetical protein